MKFLHTTLAVAFVASSVFAAPTAESVAGQINNTFGGKLFAGTKKRSEKGNKFLSPTSAYLALAIVSNGASGTTREEMEAALSTTRLGRDGMNAENAKLIKALAARGNGSELYIANAVWIKKEFEVLPAFLNRVTKPYSSRVERLDFSTEKASKTINDWTAKETRDKIQNIVPPKLPAETRLIVTNAVYFKAKWEIPFSAGATTMAAFDNGKAKVQVPTLHATRDFRYAKLPDGSEAIALPYLDKKTEMIVWLPKDRDLAPAEKDIQAGELDKIATALDAAKPARGSLSLPKLHMEYEAELNGPLGAMGMKRAFTDAADFSDLTTAERVSISSVLQKTFVAIDEEGTEAAAVTAIIVGTTSAPPPETFRMVVDRPYVFAIRDRATRTQLFIGSIQEPEGGKMPPPPKH